MKYLYLFLFICSNLFAAFEFSNTNTFSAGLAGSMASGRDGFSCFTINPAASAVSNQQGAGLSYFRPFNFSGLAFGEITAALKFRGWGTGLSVSTFGDNIYQENKFTVNTSRSFLQEKFSLGINLSYYAVSVKNYPNASTLGLDLGFQFELTQKLRTGFSIKNFNQPKLSNHAEQIPLMANWGMSLEVEQAVSTYFSVQKESWHPLNFSFGASLKLMDYFTVQSGYNTYPAVPAFGFQFSKSKISINYSLQYHMELGETHFWGISFTKNRSSSLK